MKPVATKFRPFDDRVLVKPDVGAEKIGLIYVPENARERPNYGRVISIGPGIAKRGGGMIAMPDVKPGDHVVYGEYAGQRYDFDDGEYIIMRGDDVKAVLEEEAIAS